MKRCSVKPYEGNEKYIFVSYCHKDRGVVYPIIEKMTRDGYRVWYDEGINPGTEWPEVIADHLNRCELCLAFITDNALNSHNCRREINFSLLKKKPFISVVTEEVNMSPGMQMQLSTVQSIVKYEMTEEKFFEKLYDSQLLENSLGSPDYSVAVSSYDDYQKDTQSDMARSSFSDRWFSGVKNDTKYESKKLYDNENDDKPSHTDISNAINTTQENYVGLNNENKKEEIVEKIGNKSTKKWMIPVLLCFVAIVGAVVVVVLFGGRLKGNDTSVKNNNIAESIVSTIVATEDDAVVSGKINIAITDVKCDGFITDATVNVSHTGYEYSTKDVLSGFEGLGIYGEVTYSNDFSKVDKSAILHGGELTSFDNAEYDDNELAFFSDIDSKIYFVGLPSDLPQGSYLAEVQQWAEYDSASIYIYFDVSYSDDGFSITGFEEAFDFDAWSNLGATVYFENALLYYDTDFDHYCLDFDGFIYNVASNSIDLSNYEDKKVSGKATVVEVVDKYDNATVVFSIQQIN